MIELTHGLRNRFNYSTLIDMHRGRHTYKSIKGIINIEGG